MFPHLDLTAVRSPAERGQQHGETFAQAIAHSVQTYARMFASAGVSWPQACARALEYRPIIEQVDPELMPEMDGIARGSKQNLAAILALNCRTEILPPDFMGGTTHDASSALATNATLGLVDWAQPGLDPATADGECTAMCLSASADSGQHSWLAQNWDWLGRQRSALVVLHSVDSQGLRFSTLTEAGMLAKIGLNEHGLGLGLNIVRSVRDGAALGVPVHVLLRHLLSYKRVTDASARMDVLGTIGFSASSNIPIADAHGDAGSMEVSPLGWAMVHGPEGATAHSNHFLSPTLQSIQAPLSVNLSSERRLSTAERHISAVKQQGLVALQAFLRDRSDGAVAVCRHPAPSVAKDARVESVAGVIMDLTERRWWIAPDLPDQVAFDAAPVAWH
jgi:isopenicillin-N N-acyltransferase like protein